MRVILEKVFVKHRPRNEISVLVINALYRKKVHKEPAKSLAGSLRCPLNITIKNIASFFYFH